MYLNYRKFYSFDTAHFQLNNWYKLQLQTATDSDTFDIAFIHQQLIRITEKIAFELRSKNQLTGCVSVKVRYTDFQTEQKQACIPYASADHILFSKAKDLFNKLYNRRQLIRLIGVRFTDLIPGNYQIDLFNDKQETIKLYKAIDSIKKQFGEGYLIHAAGYNKAI